jgi:hypothetical protein
MRVARPSLLLIYALFVSLYAAYANAAANPSFGTPVPMVSTTITAEAGPAITGSNNVIPIRQAPHSGSESSSSGKITLALPAGTKSETLKVVLNGRDVSSRFVSTTCSEGVCEEATLTSIDGLLEKNVLYAIAKKADETLASGRLRFTGPAANGEEGAALTRHSLSSAATAPYPTNSNFLPPSVGFSVAQGGWQSGQPWITVGSLQSYPDSSFSCPSAYITVVLNRATLAPIDTHCSSVGSELKNYLSTLASNELVIVGTTANAGSTVATDQIDTTPIGGSVYNCALHPCGGEPSQSILQPLSYLTIGAGGAQAGTAYENFDIYQIGEQYGAFATGMLVEDVSGNYNFQSAQAVEYTVNPDPAQSTVTIYGTRSFSRYSDYTKPDTLVFYSPTGVTNGYWLLVLRRDDLDFVAGPPTNYENCQAVTDPALPQTNEKECGTFYATGAADDPTATQAYQKLASDLNQIGPDELVFLVTVGTGAAANKENSFAVADTSYKDANNTTQYAYYQQFGPALERFGGTPITTLNLNRAGSTYSLVSCTNCGNALTGHSVISSTIFSQQGQTGFIHGLLNRNLNGLYWPTESSQETAAQNSAGQGANFFISKLNGMQPVEWPELTSTLLPGASTATGQVAAYHYISYQLITQYYIPTASGTYLDDLHAYFTGSLNTLINYNTFNPANLPFPGASGSCYPWNDPVTGTTLDCFTQQDFTAVALQLKTEVLYLDNALLYLINGSTNMKDVVATGNSSAALALIGAASNIQGSTLAPPPATPVSVNAANIVSLVGSVVNVGLTIESGGLIPSGASDLLKNAVSGGVTVVGDLFTGASAIAGGLTSGAAGASGGAPLPSPDYTFETTIGALANSGLQSGITAGFDVTVDNILSDWNKLSILGPQITDTSNLLYSSNQAAQNVDIAILGQASQRSMYMSLLPVYYSIQYYPSWYGNLPSTFNPDMGGWKNQEGCHTWYSPGKIPAFTSNWYPTYAGTPAYFSKMIPNNPNPVDYYIIGGTPQNPGSLNETIQTLDGPLANNLFASTGLNMPFDLFVARTGPMQSMFLDSTANGFDGWPANQTCSGQVTNGYLGGAPSSPYDTTLVLTSPSSSVVGQAVALSAQVSAQTGIPTGTVIFQDGATVLGQATLNTSGAATLPVSGLALGTHSFVAYYLVNSPYSAAMSAPETLTVYANSPDMIMSLGTQEVTVNYGATSSAISVQVTSESGLAGSVQFSCTGLPNGLTCNFNPAQASISAGGAASTSLTIAGKSTTAASMWTGVLGILFAPLTLFCLQRMRKGGSLISGALSIMVLSMITFGCMLGCSGGGTNHGPETGAKTILVNATSGSVTKTTPLILNIK